MENNEYKGKMKQAIEQNMILEQKNIVLRNENDAIRMQLAQNKMELDIYKNYHTKMLKMLEGLQTLYKENRLFEICGILSSFFEDNYKSDLKINDLKATESNILKVVSSARNENKELCNFCDSYKKIYVYGAGKKAKRLAGVLDKCGIIFEAFVVSDKETKDDALLAHDIKYLKDILEEKNEMGIIIGVNAANAREVYPLLEKYNVNNVFYFQ